MVDTGIGIAAQAQLPERRGGSEQLRAVRSMDEYLYSECPAAVRKAISARLAIQCSDLFIETSMLIYALG